MTLPRRTAPDVQCLCAQASLAAEVVKQSGGGAGGPETESSVGDELVRAGFAFIDAAASAEAAITEAGFSVLDQGLAALVLALALVAALATADNKRLAESEAVVVVLREKLSAAESAALAERTASQKLLSSLMAESEAALANAAASAVAAAMKSESERLRAEAFAAASAQAAAEGLLSAAQAEELRASIAAAREDVAARERSIQAKSEAIGASHCGTSGGALRGCSASLCCCASCLTLARLAEAKTNAIAARLLQERDSVSARVAEFEARAAAAEAERVAAVREVTLVMEALSEARARAAAAEEELAKLRSKA